MKVANGIQGIQKYRADNAKGWHVFTVEAYVGFFDENLNDLIGSWPSKTHEVIGIQGNTLTVRITES